MVTTALSSPEDTFGVLKDLLQGLESRLSYVRRERRAPRGAGQRDAVHLAGARLAHRQFGGRSDPFTGERGFHQGLDISTEKGQPVYATADGVVETAAFTGDYGNLILLDHGFGLQTRYGHLSAFEVKAGASVKRGDVIGLVGSTGRSTGSHLHYEILVNGRLINPLQLLTQPANDNAVPAQPSAPPLMPRPHTRPVLLQSLDIQVLRRPPPCRCSKHFSPRSSAPKTNAN